MGGSPGSPARSPANYVAKGVGPRGKVRKERIADALLKSLAFSGVPRPALMQEVDHMELVKVAAGETLIRVGEKGDYLYVLEAGELDVLQSPPAGGTPRVVFRAESGAVVGELALMYNCERDATVTACARGAKVWALPRHRFERAAGKRVREKRSLMNEFIAHVPLFARLDPPDRGRVADALHAEVFSGQQLIVREGQEGHKFFIVERGKAMAFRTVHSDAGDPERLEMMRYGRGSYFGELALLYGKPRACSVIALMETRCAVLDKKDFLRLAQPGSSLLQALEGELDRYT